MCILKFSKWCLDEKTALMNVKKLATRVLEELSDGEEESSARQTEISGCIGRVTMSPVATHGRLC